MELQLQHLISCVPAVVQFTPSQIVDNQNIASLRIHVERLIKRVKKYKLATAEHRTFDPCRLS